MSSLTGVWIAYALDEWVRGGRWTGGWTDEMRDPFSRSPDNLNPLTSDRWLT